MESVISVAQDAAKAVCDVMEGFVELFLGNNNRDDCARVDIFDTPNYDYLEKYVKCQVNNLDNGADLEPVIGSIATRRDRIELFGKTMLKFFDCLGGDNENIGDCMTSCLGGPGSRASASSLFSTFLATKRDFRAAHNEVLLPMNTIFSTVCANRPNWHFVDSTMQQSLRHGLCACNENTADARYFNSLLASYSQQRSIYGTAHMNRTGQDSVYTTRLLSQLNTHLLPRENRRIAPGQEACMRPVSPFSPALRQTSARMDAEIAAMDGGMAERLRQFRTKYGPAIKIIIDIFNPKLFADQFMQRQFAPLRRARQ
jgi:hypothetical protein